MNTIEITNQAPTSSKRRPVTRRLAGMLIGALAMAGTVVGVAATESQSAEAASGASYCFRHNNGSPYTYETYLQLYYNGTWNTVAALGRVGRTGCNYVSISGWYRNHPARVMAYTRVGTYQFIGVTPKWAPAGSLTYNLGRGWVNN